MKALSGIRVIDLTMWAFVPSAGCVLAQWGADVIKVENPHACDPMRTFATGSLEPGGAHPWFKHYNRGKRGIAIDLSTDAGREILYQLVRDADVFLTSYLPATRRKLKIDLEDIRSVNPRIIYARGSGQGPRGPEAERSAYGSTSFFARGSLTYSGMTAAGAERPFTGPGHDDAMAGHTLAGGICAGLLQRERTGVAPLIDGTLLGTAIWFNGHEIIRAKTEEDTSGAAMASIQQSAGQRAYRTRDGRFLLLCFLGDLDEDWFDLYEHLGKAELAADPRFSTAASRLTNNLEMVRELDELFATRDYGTWKQILLTTKGVWAPVQQPIETYDDPQTIANGFIREVDYPDGPLALPSPAILFDEDPGDPSRAPDFGEHTDDVLAEAGFTASAIAQYRESGVVL
ncbi:CaiB/BaiF CoA transferase family protein [Jatrophihabitans sp. DSM 45814]